jgi:hypothetical protein
MFGISTHPRQVQYLHWIGKREKGEAPRYNAYQREYFGAKEQAS